MADATGGNMIQAGTAQGALDFLEYLVDKGYGSGAAVNPLRSAVKQVFTVVEGSDDFGGADVRSLELEEFLDRFETKARGELKVESIQAYRRRFTRAHEAYLTFLETGRTPSFSRPRGQSTAAGTTEAAARRPRAGTAKTTLGDSREDLSRRMIEYPFPLRNGQVATLRLPARFEKQDAERLAAFVRTLVFEPLLELPPAGGESADA